MIHKFTASYTGHSVQYTLEAEKRYWHCAGAVVSDNQAHAKIAPDV